MEEAQMKRMKQRTLTGTPSPAVRPYEVAHRSLAREAAGEGIVLLKNEGEILPLKKGSRVALFGAGASATVKGGTGSGDVNERDSVTVYQGLVNAGFQVTTGHWLEEYQRIYRESREAWRQGILRHTAELEAQGNGNAFFEAYTASPYYIPVGPKAEQTEAEVALFVLSRVAGENADRRAAAQDYFLSGEEEALLGEICRMYQQVIVLINAGGVCDLSFLDQYPQIKGLLVISQPGMEGGNAVADVLSGVVNPSGKLTDSWAYGYKDYPNARTYSHNSGDVTKEFYQEGIYVGYRYFDSFGVTPRYGFGEGLSYTTFTQQMVSISADRQGTVTVVVQVKNTGSVPGKEVVQVYAALPDGSLEKEAHRLVAFGKTQTLRPHEEEVLTLRFPPERLESYDESAASWVVEQGIYGICVGPSLKDAVLSGSLRLGETKILTKVRPICPLQEELPLLSLSEDVRRRRNEALEQAAASLPQVEYDLSQVKTRTVEDSDTEPEDEAQRITRTLSVDQLIQLATGDTEKGQGATVGNAGVSVPGSAGETSSCALEQGVANLVLADGPAGLRLNQHYYAVDGKAQAMPFVSCIEHGIFATEEEPVGEKRYQFCTAIPVGTMLAQTWNLPLMEQVGSMIGEEMEEFGVQLWLAPGMNLHRNPLCGRNFEYFSEDPLLSGRCAAAMTRGVQSHRGLGTTIKHFACNNQEDNRMACDSIVGERTLRELYLKSFQIAIEEAQPKAIMTSYNLVNGVHAANSYDLCTRAARMEFGFRGLIMTDWCTTNVDEKCTAAGCMRAGNDLVMPGMPMDHENLRAELAQGTLTEAQLRRCITRLVRVVLESNCYA
jgi:beta-glucosidase